MEKLPQLFNNNRRWVKQMIKGQPDFFKNLAQGQTPDYLWIGCSDSRVPANEIIGLGAGKLFVHRNIANLVVHTDMNCLSVLQYAVEVLKVKHVIVCGHYGCGGVKAAIENHTHGLVDNWLRHIRDLFQHYTEEINSIKNPEKKLNRLCELNVQKQVFNVSNSTIVHAAWSKGQSLSIHGWIFNIETGFLKDLNLTVSSNKETAGTLAL